jgi:uncharacterized caspase-like protein
VQFTISNRIVAVLDCCHSGAIKLEGGRAIKKGDQETAAAKSAVQSIRKGAEMVKKKLTSGKGIAILSACLGSQEAESTAQRDYSIFTYYLLQGLKALDNEYVDNYGNVTTSLLGNYVYDKVTRFHLSLESYESNIILSFNSASFFFYIYIYILL